ncbi:MAG: diaminopimelate decarboxylase [Oscillospiraceae bacterium]|jgi:diaminopimelate decarboxylase|nr:diaminopimelate decarboxylase [Oscillospiraceae bacterium]
MKTPFVTAAALQEITARYPTPFHLYNAQGIRATARRLQAAFAWNPGFREFFAVKALPNPYILRLLRAEGCGVDCSSYAELLLARACGFSGEDIMFSSNQTPAEDYRLASELGALINLDDITHIDFLADMAGLPDTLSCRYNPGDSFSIHNAVMDTPAQAKYGFTRAQLTDGYERLLRRGVQNFGLHAFLASNTNAEDYYPVLAGLLFETAVQLHRETGARIDFINLSGGVGIPYEPNQTPIDIMAVGEGVRRAYERVLTPAGLGDVRIFTELGRYITGPHGCLVTRAIHRKHIHKEYIGVDACTVDLMRPAMYGAYHHITVAGKEAAPQDHVYDVVGGLCENNDKLAVDRPLPQIDTGDLLIIHDTGAHGHAMGYNYNAKLRHAELLLEADGSVRLIRRAETPKDYFATLDFATEFDLPR